MKIAICNDRVNLGGVEIILQTLVTYFIERGEDVTIIASPNDYEEFEAVFGKNARFIQGRWPSRSYPRNPMRTFGNLLFRKVYRLFSLAWISIHKYDICIAIKEGVTLKDGMSVRAKRKYAWIHSDLRVFTGFLRGGVFSSISEANACLKKYNKIVCVSQTALQGVVETVGDTGNLCVRYNPINWRLIRRQAEEPCDCKKNSGRPLLVAVGRLVPGKNFLKLLECCNIIYKDLNFDLWIIGEGPERFLLEEYIKSNGLDFVKLLGFQNNPYPLMKQADLFVSTSISESYGLAVQEALILGVPVLAVRCPGIVESFDTRFGLLVDDDTKELARTVSDLLTDSARLTEYRKEIKERYSLDSLFEERLCEIGSLLE